ncbi:hypothetical protein [Nonomuraea sp. NPDC050202]|uniref:hypothetical protein n=1 Tax=Nonomuraea sp. NPDC050202 TaxID=3155035 RepID=UPI0033E4A431
MSKRAAAAFLAPFLILLPSLVSPFGVCLSRVHAATVPDDVLDAARSGRAGEWRIFVQIVLSGALQRFWRAGLTEGSVRE